MPTARVRHKKCLGINAQEDTRAATTNRIKTRTKRSKANETKNIRPTSWANMDSNSVEEHSPNNQTPKQKRANSPQKPTAWS